MLTRATGVALWRQIAGLLNEELAQGRAGGRLPSEQALAARFGVSRHTVRRALAELAGRGALRTEQGRGSFATGRRIDYPITARTRFTANILGAGRAPGGRLLRVREEAADGETAAALALAPGAPVAAALRLGEADGQPVSLSRTFVARARFPGFAAALEQEGSITRAFAASGVADYRRDWTAVGAELPDRRDAGLLAMAAGEPVLVVRSVDIDPEDRPISFAITRFPATRVRLRIAGEEG